MHPVIIDIASQSDLQEILRLQKEAYLSEAEIYDDFNIPPLKQSVAEIEQEYVKGVILKAEHEGRLIGSVRGYEDAGRCHIGKLIVKPEYQNKGMGSKLLREIESRFPGAKVFELFTGHKSHKNLHLYKKHGYTEVFREGTSSSLTMVVLHKRSSVLEG